LAPSSRSRAVPAVAVHTQPAMADTVVRDLEREGFEAVSELVKSWRTGDFVHHVRHTRDKGLQGHEYLVIFSIPQPTKPVPEHVAQATFTVKMLEGGDSPKITYVIESQQQRLDATKLPIRKVWLEAALKRKRKALSDSRMFELQKKLPPPQPFIPGQYKMSALLVENADARYDQTEDELLDAMGDLGNKMEIAMKNDEESVEELEAMLVSVFKGADADGNGYLDPAEFSSLLDTAELGLGEQEKLQLLTLCDMNGDGRIEYAEFAPLGADVIQTMRLRVQAQAQTKAIELHAELQARQTLHNLGRDEVTASLLAAFKAFDSNSTGRLEYAELEQLLNEMVLGATKLTQQEIRGILVRIDKDKSGTIEYDEFAPFMFDYMVESLKFDLVREQDGSAYLHQHLNSFDTEGRGTLTLQQLKHALMKIDLVHLTPIQVASLVSEATKEAGIVNSHGVVVEVEVQAAVPHVVTLLMQFGSPSLQRKREIVSEMATVTPLEALTVDEKKRLAEMAHDVFIKFDTDRSGSLDRNEFSKCLVEGKLGLTERQIAHMMAAADVSEDGLIDYSEFEVLFNDCLLVLARDDKLDKMLQKREEQDALEYELIMLLDELMIPLHIAFDLSSGGEESMATTKVVEVFKTKAPEWGLMEKTIEVVCTKIVSSGAEITSWPELVNAIEHLALGGR